MLAPDTSFSKRFSVYGIRVAVQSAQRLDWLEADFAYFQSGELAGGSDIFLAIEPRALAKPPELAASRYGSECIIYQDGQEVWIDYQGRAWLHRQGSSATLYVDDADLRQELSYLFLQSLLGQKLEERGLYRVHSLSFSYQGKGVLLLLPSGGGKSTLALELLHRKDVTLFGDDICLADLSGRLWPYPMRFSFSENAPLGLLESKAQLWQRRKYGRKKLLAVKDLPYPPESLVATKIKAIVIGTRWTKKARPEVCRATQLELFGALLREMVVGIGLPQVAELVLQPKLLSNWKLLGTASRRLLVACGLLFRARKLKLSLSQDPATNAEELLTALRNLTI